MWIDGVFGLIVFAVAWSLIREGLWGAAIIFFEILIAGLVAMNFFEPLAELLNEYVPFLAGYEDGLTLLVLFGLTLFVLREADGALWPNMVRFPGVVHRAGAAVFGVLSGLAITGFLLCAFQTFPLPAGFMGYDNEKKMVVGLGLDRYWLRFTQQMSQKAFSRGKEHVFDPDAAYIDMYQIRRTIGVASSKEEGGAAGAGGEPVPEKAREGPAF